MVSGSVVLLVLAGSHKLLDPKSRSSSTKRSCLVSSGNKCERKKKRVRFAAELVEPCGNNEKYGGRGHSLVPARRLPATAPPDFETCDRGVKRSSSVFPSDKSTTKSDVAKDGDVLREISCVGRPVEERRIQTVAKPNIPANRRILYNGMLQYSRMQRASVY